MTVAFSTGARVTTDTTGRAAFVVPSAPGVVFASIEGRHGRVALAVVPAAAASTPVAAVRTAPRFAALTDRFDITGSGLCSDADANHVIVAGRSALVLAASSLALMILPPEGLPPGPAQVTLSCADGAPVSFSLTFLSLELLVSAAPLKPGERRDLLVRVAGTKDRVPLEARNLAPEIAELAGGNPVRLSSTGGPENSARFELRGHSHGSFLISIRLVPVYSLLHP